MKWKGWLRAFENYIISIDGQGYSPERKKSLLFGLLGKAGQEKIIMKDVRVDGAEGTDDVDEWQTHEARDVVIDEEECVNTPSRPGISGQASAERCEKAWRGLTAASGQNGCRPESVESDSHNVMGSSLEDACAVKANSLQYVTPSRPIRRIRAPKRFEDFVMRRLMTPRPICNEDGRDVRGRRGGKAEARESAVLRPAGCSWALFLVARIKDINMKSASFASFILATTAVETF
ncbi:hypothetical protein NDU88_010147 [Pleurodeles waltl]|uniref:Uncharacterized protein n=1 Tax=Pleurodeles waltl TaxID=8319 RepID=A0AAV7PXV5_PLEWA|nr:hypothetical protein NDU88_010147 [Pleurodeles waltl]